MSKGTCIAAAVLALAGAAPLDAQPPVNSLGPEVKDGPGKELFLMKCTACHQLFDVVSKRKNRADWDTTVHNMIGLGAQLSDDDIKTLVTYLSTQYGLQ